jgi:hypothetical protein
MTGQRFGVGIVGLQPGRSWAARAHIPALRALSESYEIVGVANTSLASALRPRALPAGFIAPCLPTSAPQPPCGALRRLCCDGRLRSGLCGWEISDVF